MMIKKVMTSVNNERSPFLDWDKRKLFLCPTHINENGFQISLTRIFLMKIDIRSR